MSDTENEQAALIRRLTEALEKVTAQRDALLRVCKAIPQEIEVNYDLRAAMPIPLEDMIRAAIAKTEEGKP